MINNLGKIKETFAILTMYIFVFKNQHSKQNFSIEKHLDDPKVRYIVVLLVHTSENFYAYLYLVLLCSSHSVRIVKYTSQIHFKKQTDDFLSILHAYRIRLFERDTSFESDKENS